MPLSRELFGNEPNFTLCRPIEYFDRTVPYKQQVLDRCTDELGLGEQLLKHLAETDQVELIREAIPVLSGIIPVAQIAEPTVQNALFELSPNSTIKISSNTYGTDRILVVNRPVVDRLFVDFPETFGIFSWSFPFKVKQLLINHWVTDQEPDFQTRVRQRLLLHGSPYSSAYNIALREELQTQTVGYRDTNMWLEEHKSRIVVSNWPELDHWGFHGAEEMIHTLEAAERIERFYEAIF